MYVLGMAKTILIMLTLPEHEHTHTHTHPRARESGSRSRAPEPLQTQETSRVRTVVTKRSLHNLAFRPGHPRKSASKHPSEAENHNQNTARSSKTLRLLSHKPKRSRSMAVGAQATGCFRASAWNFCAMPPTTCRGSELQYRGLNNYQYFFFCGGGGGESLL